MLLNHPFYCRGQTITDLKAFCLSNRVNLRENISSTDHFAIARADEDANAYQNSILHQLVDIQEVCSHTAQVFFRDLVPGAKDETSQLFIALRNNRQLHYEVHAEKDMEQRAPYGMHHILYFLE